MCQAVRVRRVTCQKVEGGGRGWKEVRVATSVRREWRGARHLARAVPRAGREREPPDEQRGGGEREEQREVVRQQHVKEGRHADGGEDAEAGLPHQLRESRQHGGAAQRYLGVWSVMRHPVSVERDALPCVSVERDAPPCECGA